MTHSSAEVFPQRLDTPCSDSTSECRPTPRHVASILALVLLLPPTAVAGESGLNEFGPFRSADSNIEVIDGLFAEIRNQGSGSSEICSTFAVNSDVLQVQATVARNASVCLGTQAPGDLRARVRDGADPSTVLSTVDLLDPETGNFELVTATVTIPPPSLDQLILVCVFSDSGDAGESAYFILQDAAPVNEGREFRDGVLSSNGIPDPMILIAERTGITINRPPFAYAGPDQIISDCSTDPVTVGLGGSQSSDPDGDSLTSYAWIGSGGTIATPDQADTMVDVPATSADYSFTLTVNDGYGGSDVDTTLVTVFCEQDPSDVYPAIDSILPNPVHRHDDCNPVRFCANRAPANITFPYLEDPVGEEFQWRFEETENVIASTTDQQCVEVDAATLWDVGGYEKGDTTRTVELRDVPSGVSDPPGPVPGDSAELTISPPPELEHDCPKGAEWIADILNIPFEYHQESSATVTSFDVALTDLDYTFTTSGNAPVNTQTVFDRAVAANSQDSQAYRYDEFYVWEHSVCWGLMLISPGDQAFARPYDTSVMIEYVDSNSCTYQDNKTCGSEIRVTDAKKGLYFGAVVVNQATLYWLHSQYTVGCVIDATAWAQVTAFGTPWYPAVWASVYGVCTARANLIAGVIWAATLGVCTEAQDPVLPDYDYLSSASPEIPGNVPVGFYDRTNDLMDAATRSGESGSYFVAYKDAYDEARSKLAGAIERLGIDPDAENGMRLQAADVLRLGEWAAEEAESFDDAVDDYVTELTNSFSRVELETQMQTFIDDARGDPPLIPDEVDEAIADQAHQDALITFLRHPSTTATGIVDTIMARAEGLATLADAIRDQAYFTAPSGELTVALTSPRKGTRVSGQVTIDARVVDRTAQVGNECGTPTVVGLTVDDEGIPVPVGLPVVWDSRTVSDGSHSLEVTVVDRSGIEDPLNPLTDEIVFWVDNTGPSVSLNEPERRRYGLDEVLSLMLNVSDPGGAGEQILQVLIDDETFLWDESLIIFGLEAGQAHVIEILAVDGAGNVTRDRIGFRLCETYRHDDSTPEDEVGLGMLGDVGVKRLQVDDDVTEAESGRVWILAREDESGGSTDSTYRLEINGHEVDGAIASGQFPVGEGEWVSFTISDLSVLGQGENYVSLMRSSAPGGADLAIRTDTDNTGSSQWISGGSSCGTSCNAELMMFVELCFPDQDCNMNGVDDRIEIAEQPILDRNNDGVLDACAPITRVPAVRGYLAWMVLVVLILAAMAGALWWKRH